jgi:hypothetical protein
MNKVAAVVLCVLVAGCEATTEDSKTRYSVPEHLNDCSFTYMRNTNGNAITVVRCPNSSTSTVTQEKSPKAVVVIDGVQYEKVKK